MKYLHTMVRVSDLDESLDFYCNKLGLVELRRYDSEAGRFTLVFLAAPGDDDAQGRRKGRCGAHFPAPMFISTPLDAMLNSREVPP